MLGKTNGWIGFSVSGEGNTEEIIVTSDEIGMGDSKFCRLRVVPHFSSRDSRASETRARVKITPREKRRHAACRLFSRGVIFTRARVSLALLSLEEKWGTTRSLGSPRHVLYSYPPPPPPLSTSLPSDRKYMIDQN